MDRMDEIVVSGVKMGAYNLRFEEGDRLQPGFLEKAELDIRETPDRKIKSLIEFKTLLGNESELNVPLDGNDVFFYAFLRCCKFYSDSAFRRMKKMYDFKRKYPLYFENIVPRTERNVFAHNILTVSPQRDQHGRRVLILQLGKWNVLSCTLVEITRGIILIIEAAILEPKTQISGSILILDLDGFGFQHILHLTPKYAKMIIDWSQDCVPLRIKAVHVVNQSYLFNMAFAVFKPFIKEKFRNRIHLHGTDYLSLSNHIEPKFLPMAFGGLMDIPLNEGISLWRLLYQYNDRYEKTSRYGYTKCKSK